MALGQHDNVPSADPMSEEQYQDYIKRKNKNIKELYNDIPSGRRKSGKFWKNPRSRHATMKKDKCMKSTWQEKTKKRLEMKNMKSYEKELAEQRISDLRAKRMLTAEKKKRKLANERKAEVVQPITNMKKLKKIKKKHLRKTKIEMR